jgi:tetratricopeptide (TPR) repeat protein
MESNVFLFPKTVDYYQIELTRLLETERYSEAIGVLRFLLQCRHEDDNSKEEWGSLLEWLENTFPDSKDKNDEGKDIHYATDGEDPEESEEDLFKRRVWLKSAEDSQFAVKLLDTLVQTDSPDKQLLALEQLQHVEHSRTKRALREWLENARIHPIVQFKALQVLKVRGDTGLIKLHKLGQAIELDTQETPLNFEQFPQQISLIRKRVQEVNEINQPALAYFVEQTWDDFLAFIYGTSIYQDMIRSDGDTVDIWAAALHHTLQETMFALNDEEATREIFGIQEEQQKAWQKACQVMKLFLTVTASGDN